MIAVDTTTPVTTDLLEPVLLHDPTPTVAPPLDEYIPVQANKTLKGYTEGSKANKVRPGTGTPTAISPSRP